MKKQSVIMLSFCAALSASALEVTKDWKIVYPDKAVGVETVVEGSLKYMADLDASEAGRPDRLARAIVPAARELSEELSGSWPSDVYAKIVAVIEGHCRQIA